MTDSSFVFNWIDKLFEALGECKTQEESDILIGNSGEIFTTLLPKEKQTAFFYLLGKVKRQ